MVCAATSSSAYSLAKCVKSLSISLICANNLPLLHKHAHNGDPYRHKELLPYGIASPVIQKLERFVQRENLIVNLNWTSFLLNGGKWACDDHKSFFVRSRGSTRCTFLLAVKQCLFLFENGLAFRQTLPQCRRYVGRPVFPRSKTLTHTLYSSSKRFLPPCR